MGVRTSVCPAGLGETRGAFTPWGSYRVAPQGSGVFLARFTDIALDDDVVLQAGRSTPLALVGTLPPGLACLLLPFEGRATVLLNGGTPRPYDVAVYGAGAEYEAANPQDTGWALLALPAVSVRGLLDPPRGCAIRRAGSFALIGTDPAAWALAANLTREAMKAAWDDPEVFAVEEARRSLRASLLEAAQGLLAPPASPRDERRPPPHAWTGAAAPLRRVVRAADALLYADPARPIDGAGLAAALGTSEQRLRLAFATVLGLTPERYLRARRLMMLRVALGSASRLRPSLNDAVAAYGLERSDRLEGEYAAMFGETPAATVTAAGRGRR
jgi:methylphosphotriester-DNA--protein-cysteine methyltransferase